MNLEMNVTISNHKDLANKHVSMYTEICFVRDKLQVGSNSLFAGKPVRTDITSPAIAMQVNKSGRDNSFVKD